MTRINEAVVWVVALVQAAQEQEEGQGLVEYGLVLALVSILAVAALGTLSGAVNGALEDIAGAF